MFKKADAGCQSCVFADQCEPVHLQRVIALKMLKAPEKYSSDELKKAGVGDDLLAFAKAHNATEIAKKLNRNETDRKKYAEVKKSAGATVRPYNNRSELCADDLAALKKAENRRNVAAYRARKKAAEAANPPPS